MTKRSCNSHHACVCVSHEEGLISCMTAVSYILIRFCIFLLIIDDTVPNNCGLISMCSSPKSLSCESACCLLRWFLFTEQMVSWGECWPRSNSLLCQGCLERWEQPFSLSVPLGPRRIWILGSWTSNWPGIILLSHATPGESKCHRREFTTQAGRCLHQPTRDTANRWVS